MTADSDTPDSPTPPEAAEAVPAKPARRKRAVKPAGDTDPGISADPENPVADVSAAATDAAAPDPSAETAAVAKPARKRRSAASADAAPPEDGMQAEAVPQLEAAMALNSLHPQNSQNLPPPLPADPAAVEAAGAETEGAVEATAEGTGSDDGMPNAEGSVEGGGRGRRRRKDRPPRSEREPRPAGAESAAVPTEARGEPDAGDDDDDDNIESALPRPEPADPGEVFAQVVSGEFDAGGEELPEPPPPHKRVLLPEPEAPKLQKVLAQSGIGSRRDMETLIQEGQVSVNGEPAHIGQRISFGDRIAVRGKPIRVRIVPPPPRIIAYHKPVGEVVTHDDPQQRPTVFRRLPRLPQGKWQSVGRLDLNTEGLLLFTNSGELANQLMHPRFGVEREYAVRVLGKLDELDKAQLLEGVNIDGQTASFRSIEDGGGEGANHWYRVVITEGRNREVRKLFDAVELTVSRLIRIRYGTVVLPRGLKRGVWVDLDSTDVRAIRQLAGGPKPEGRPAQPGQHQGQGHPGGKQQDRGRNKQGRGDRPVNERAPQHQANRGPQSGSGGNGGNGSQGGPGQGNFNGPRQGRPATPSPDFQAAPERERNDDLDDDFDPSRIPNPLEQTFDKRFVQNPRTPAGGRGFGRGGGGFGAGGSAPPPGAPRKPGAPREPDPLQTSVGYIGADAFHRKTRGGGGGGGGSGGNRGGRFGGGAGGGGNRSGGGGKRGR